MSGPDYEKEWSVWTERNSVDRLGFIAGAAYGFIIGTIIMGGLWYVSV